MRIEMKRTLFFAALLVLIVTYTVFYVGSKNNKPVCLTPEEVQEINLRTQALIRYGKGPISEGRFPTEKEILAAGEGHCAMYVYLFCKNLSRRGAQGTVYGIKAPFFGESSGSHALVEVETSEGVFVFDPTHGVYYDTDLKTLISSGRAMAYLHGTPSINGAPFRGVFYLTDRFFSDASYITCYPNICDDGDLKLLKEGTRSFTSVNAEWLQKGREYSFVLHEQLPIGAIETKFVEPTELYRIKIGFSSKLWQDVSVNLKITDEKGERLASGGWVRQTDFTLEYQLSEPVVASAVYLQLKTRADEAMLPKVAYYQMYQ